MCAVDLQLLLFLYCKNKYVELIFKLIMLIHVYFRHAELWHVHPVIQYKCTNINIKSAMKSAYTERERPPIIIPNRLFRVPAGIHTVYLRSRQSRI